VIARLLRHTPKWRDPILFDFQRLSDDRAEAAHSTF
jgi:hypothetical protein